MGLPEFPDLANPAPFDDIIDRLLESIAIEELALAALVNAEAEKIQALAAADISGPLAAEDVTAINDSVIEVITQVEAKEEQLRAKLTLVLSARQALENGENGGNGG